MCILRSSLHLNLFAFVDLQTALSMLPMLLQTAGLCPVQCPPVVCDTREEIAPSELLLLWLSSFPYTGAGGAC